MVERSAQAFAEMLKWLMQKHATMEVQDAYQIALVLSLDIHVLVDLIHQQQFALSYKSVGMDQNKEQKHAMTAILCLEMDAVLLAQLNQPVLLATL